MASTARLQETAEGSLEAPFHAVITPHRSISPAAGRRIEYVVIAISVLLQAGFAAFGIWIATTFMFLETALVIWGLRAFARWMDRSEDVRIDGGHLIVERRKAGARAEVLKARLNEVVLVGRQQKGWGLKALEVRHGGRPFEIAADLLPTERETFRETLLNAIRKELNR